MFSIWTLISITLIYVLVLFVVAIIGDRAKRLPKSVYSLALGIHCTSWAFFGTTTQAAQFGWPLIPTYIGVILVMLFGFKLLLRVNTICKQYNVSSIAEFISIRYNHSNLIAVIVTLICVIGVIPYIALQLDAIALALNLLIIDFDDWSGSVSLYVTIGMAIFAIWFGARKMSLTERNSGLMLTIATQSIVKLVALLIVGLFVVYSVFDGFVDLFEQSLKSPNTRELIDRPFAVWVYLSHVILGVCSMFCLPRQFHINFVENRNEEELHQARWLFPAYLIGMTIFILPIALAGMIFFADASPLNGLVAQAPQYSTDSFVLAIPIAVENKSIAIVAFIGGLAASTSMVIVATLALGNMVANSLITPLLFAFNAKKIRAQALHTNEAVTQASALGTKQGVIPSPLRLSGQAVLHIRQLTILIMLCIAYAYHVHISQQATLVQTGTIALSLLSQTFPAIVFGIYWRQANRFGALCGISFGISVVIFGMLYPSITADIDSHQIALVLFFSLALNVFSIVAGSLLTRDKQSNPYASSELNLVNASIAFKDLLQLTDKILPRLTAQAFREQVAFVGNNDDSHAPSNVLSRAESLLSSHMGSASTRILLNTISNKQSVDYHDLGELAAQAGKNFQFNHKVLQASITHLPLGISVIDADMKLVAWNNLYEDLFDYPKDYLHVGKPILDILQFNAKRGLLGDSKSHTEIQKRMQNMLTGKSYKAVRPQLHNKVVEISGNSLPAGGYISCYSDITEYIQIQNELQIAKTELEKRVEKRTQELQMAKVEAEQANIGKTKFLAATSHDLMQPLNAASLFASMLQEKLQGKGEFELADNLVNSLDNAEALLNMLIDITKLENNQIKP
jgi:Na+/proline symporter